MIKRVSILLAFFICSLASASELYFQWSLDIEESYELIMRFEFDKAEEAIRKIEGAEPNNTALDWIRSDILFIKVLVEERPEDKTKFYNEYNKFFRRIERLDKSARRSSILGELYLKRGLINILNNNLLSATRDMYLSYGNYERAVELDSSSAAALLGWGVNLIIYGSIPDNYKWYAGIFGIHGDSKLGIETLESAVQRSETGSGNLKDQLCSKFSMNYFKLSSGLEDQISPLEKDLVGFKPLIYLEFERLLATGKTSEGLKFGYLNGTKNGELHFWYLDYIMGRAAVALGDDMAEELFLNYIENYPGNSFKRSASLYLSWYYLIKGEEQNFRKYSSKVEELEGDFYGADKLAFRESKLRPSVPLLKARLAFDAGSYDMADSILNSVKPDQLVTDLNKQEWHYRKARIYQAKNDLRLAMEEFMKTSDYPFDESSYILPVSCVELGEAYIGLNNPEKARFWLRKALRYSGYPYYSDYQRKAKYLLRTLE